MTKISNFFNKIPIFLREVFTELKKVNWLNRKEVLKYTLIVIVISLVVAIFLGGLDSLFTTLLRRFIL